MSYCHVQCVVFSTLYNKVEVLMKWFVLPCSHLNIVGLSKFIYTMETYLGTFHIEKESSCICSSFTGTLKRIPFESSGLRWFFIIFQNFRYIEIFISLYVLDAKHDIYYRIRHAWNAQLIYKDIQKNTISLRSIGEKCFYSILFKLNYFKHIAIGIYFWDSVDDTYCRI